MCLITVIANNASISLREWLIKKSFYKLLLIENGHFMRRQNTETREKQKHNLLNENCTVFIWKNSCPFHQRILRNKFGWNWPCGSGEDFKMSMYLRCFVIISLLEKVGSFIRGNLNPLYIEMLCVKLRWN